MLGPTDTIATSNLNKKKKNNNNNNDRQQKPLHYHSWDRDHDMMMQKNIVDKARLEPPVVCCTPGEARERECVYKQKRWQGSEGPRKRLPE